MRRKQIEHTQAEHIARMGGIWANSNYDKHDASAEAPRMSILQGMHEHYVETLAEIFDREGWLAKRRAIE